MIEEGFNQKEKILDTIIFRNVSRKLVWLDIKKDTNKKESSL